MGGRTAGSERGTRPRVRTVTDEFGGARRSELENPREQEDAMNEESRIRITRVGMVGAA
jgi:hypothetical protein